MHDLRYIHKNMASHIVKRLFNAMQHQSFTRPQHLLYRILVVYQEDVLLALNCIGEIKLT